jgi:hypothetical protein
MELRNDIDQFLNSIDKNVCVVAATKYVDSSKMRDLYNHNVTNFGENRVDSFLTKYDELKDLDIKWHFIGHLQSNKCKDVINKIDYLHSLDSLKLAEMIDKQRTTPLNCFIEVSINLEENKNGVDYRNINEFVKEVLKYKNIKLVGFMMMAIKNDEEDNLEKQFMALYDLKNKVSKEFNIDIPYLSMGMSDDYKEAIKAHATHIRLGRILWTN